MAKDKIVKISEDEIEAAMADEVNSRDVYFHTFSRPFEWEGKTYETLTFDFGALTGRDSLAIEAELLAMGKPVAVREIVGEYQIRAAVRACREKIGVDALEAMPLKDCNRILNHVRNFLLAAG